MSTGRSHTLSHRLASETASALFQAKSFQILAMRELGLGIFGLGDASLYKEIRSEQRDVWVQHRDVLHASHPSTVLAEAGIAGV